MRVDIMKRPQRCGACLPDFSASTTTYKVASQGSPQSSKTICHRPRIYDMVKGDLSKNVEVFEERLVDTTKALPLRSKRTERRRKKRHQREEASKQHATLFDLPLELLLDILTLLRPSDIFRLSRVNRTLRTFVAREEEGIAKRVIAGRYAVLSKCFLVPVLLEKVNEDAYPALLSDERQTMLNIHKRPYQHIQRPDHHAICTCLTCMLSWNNLNLVVDFAHWQNNLNKGEPIPMIPRGKNPKWNQKLVEANAEVVRKALRSWLWYACILECHLNTTVGAIFRHGNNKGNKRWRFRMSASDAVAGTDVFLERSGPPSMDFPFHRDNYYMLEAYLPNRGWNAELNEWRYMPDSQHDHDIEFVKAWAKRRQEAEESKGNGPEKGKAREAEVPTESQSNGRSGASQQQN